MSKSFKSIERIKEINSHKWHWTEKAQQAFSDLTGNCFYCQYCGAELEYQYEIENESGEKLYVGSECMKKIGWIQTDADKKKIKEIKENLKKAYSIKKAEIETGIKIGSIVFGIGEYAGRDSFIDHVEAKEEWAFDCYEGKTIEYIKYDELCKRWIAGGWSVEWLKLRATEGKIKIISPEQLNSVERKYLGRIKRH